MPEIGNLRASLSANSAQFEADMQRARNAVRKNAKGMETAMDRVGKKFAAASSALNRFGGIAVAGAAAGAAAFVKQQIDVADKMGKLAQSTGTTSEYLSSMALVASQAGTTLEVVAKASNRLSMNMADMRRGVGESKEAFEDLGIVVADDAGVLRSTDDVMKDIADRFAGMEDGADKTALAMRLFGKAGAELIPMLNMGSAGISDLQAKAEEMGLVISTKTALEAAMLNDQLDILQKRALGAGRSIALDLVPWLNEAISTIAAAKEESGTLTAAWVGLGAIGDALYTSSTKEKLNDAREDIKEFTADIERYKSSWRMDVDQFFGVEEKALEILNSKLKEAQSEADKLSKQLQQEEAAEQSAMEAALEKQRKEAEERRKNTEAMRAQAEARLKEAKLTREQEAAEKARVREAEAALAAIDGQIKAIELQAATYGMTSDQIAIYTLKLAGANDEQLKAAELALADVSAKKAQADAVDELAKAQERLQDKGKSITESVRTPTEEYQAKIEELDELLLNDAISHETWARAANKAWKDTEGAARQSTDKMSTFMDQAARNMQDVMADGLFDFMQGELGDLEDSFKRTLDRMVANALAAELGEAIFGVDKKDAGRSGGWLDGIFGGAGGGSSNSGGSSGGGFLDGAFDLIGSFLPSFEGGGYTGGGSRSGGMDGKGGYLSLVHPNETVVDHSNGQSSGGGVSVSISVSGVRDEGGLRKTAAQIAQQSGLAAQRAMARNG